MLLAYTQLSFSKWSFITWFLSSAFCFTGVFCSGIFVLVGLSFIIFSVMVFKENKEKRSNGIAESSDISESQPSEDQSQNSPPSRDVILGDLAKLVLASEASESNSVMSWKGL